MKKINIAFLGNQIASGGGSASLLLMIKSIDRTKYNIFVLSSDCASEEVKKEFEQFSNVVIVNKEIKQFVSCAGHPPSLKEYVKAKSNVKKQVRIILNFIRTNKVDILHINNAVFSHLYKGIKEQTKVKIVSHIRERVHLYNKKFLQNNIIKNIEKYSDKIITISEKEAEAFTQQDKITIIPNPFDFSRIKKIEKSDLRKQYKINDNDVIIAMMGRFAKDKGHMLFLKAVKYFKDYINVENVKFLLLGINPSKPKWKLIIKKILFIEDFRSVVLKYIKNNNLEDNIILLPYVMNVYPIINEVDIYVRPSLFADPWGRDIIEAMALKRIVIATGDYEFFIKDGHSGFLVPKLTPKNLGNKIIEVFKLGKNRIEIGINATKSIQEKTNLKVFRTKLELVYNSMV